MAGDVLGDQSGELLDCSFLQPSGKTIRADYNQHEDRSRKVLSIAVSLEVE